MNLTSIDNVFGMASEDLVPGMALEDLVQILWLAGGAILFWHVSTVASQALKMMKNMEMRLISIENCLGGGSRSMLRDSFQSPIKPRRGSLILNEMRECPRPLELSRRQFQECFCDIDDVDICAFMHAASQFSLVLERLGTWTLVMTRECSSNVKKVDQTYQLNPSLYRSMRELLQAEIDSGMHEPNGILADPSSAMGLLWGRRGLRFWARLFTIVLEDSKSKKAEDLCLEDIANRAHEAELQQYTGWISNSSFNMVAKTMPDWENTFAKLGVGREQVIGDMVEWARTVELVLERMQAMHIEYDLEDVRRSL